MQTARTLLIMGIWIVILPYLGFPLFWKNMLFTLTGFGLMYIAYNLYVKIKVALEKKKRKFDNFSENERINNESN
jgi:hypothetical protein